MRFSQGEREWRKGKGVRCKRERERRGSLIWDRKLGEARGRVKTDGGERNGEG